MSPDEELFQDLQSLFTLKVKQNEQYHWSEQSILLMELGRVGLAQRMDARVQELNQELADLVALLRHERGMKE